MPESSTIYSCVIDNAPLYHLQGWIWLHSAQSVRRQSASRLILHHIGPLPEALIAKAEACGAEVRGVGTFGAGPGRFCNKLQQLDWLVAQDAEYVILCDADLAFVSDPAAVASKAAVRAKIVDKANPPAQTLLALFEAAGLGVPPLNTPVDFDQSAKTHARNCNGGLYIIPGAFLAGLAEAWMRWARYCLDRESLLGYAVGHADQLGFLLAMEELALPFEPLDTAWNCPTHFAGEEYHSRPERTPDMLHYHDRLMPEGYLLAPDTARLWPAVDAVNARLIEAPDRAGLATLAKRWDASR